MGYLWWFTEGSLVRGGRVARDRHGSAPVRGGAKAPGRRGHGRAGGPLSGHPGGGGRLSGHPGEGGRLSGHPPEGRGGAAAGRWS
jgi:hypothetical protein